MTVNETQANSNWYQNSSYSPFEYTLAKKIALLVSFSIATGFLIHSSFINGGRWHKIRWFTDIILIETIICCAVLHISGTYADNSKLVIIFQSLICYGFLGCSVQVIDNYFVYVLYRATQLDDLTWPEKFVINIWIWITCFTYMPWVTILPCFIDTNTGKAERWSVITGGYLWSAMYVCYNIYFGWKIWYAIRKRYSRSEWNMKVQRSKCYQVEMLTYRNILHLVLV